MQLISEEYCALNSNLHDSNEKYGTSGYRWAKDVFKISKELNTTDVLDYGCGKGTLGQNLPFPIKQYDPAIPEHSEIPQPADIVVCTDVLEHVEPEMLDSVLIDIYRCMKMMVFFNISTLPAKKTLADGRNAHLIIENSQWWLGKLMKHFHIQTFLDYGGCVTVIAEHKNHE